MATMAVVVIVAVTTVVVVAMVVVAEIMACLLYTSRPENENALIEVKNGKHFAYRFRTNTNDGLLKESHIGLSGTRCV